jgi:hypothetical protein
MSKSVRSASDWRSLLDRFKWLIIRRGGVVDNQAVKERRRSRLIANIKIGIADRAIKDIYHVYN